MLSCVVLVVNTLGDIPRDYLVYDIWYVSVQWCLLTKPYLSFMEAMKVAHTTEMEAKILNSYRTFLVAQQTVQMMF